MTATEVLRRLLDKHDEYYKTSGNKTWWGRPIDRQTGKPINVFHYQAQPMGEDRLLVELQLATPEQAIAATLGATDANPTQAKSSGTCHDKGTFSSWGLFTCSNCSIVFPLDAVKDAPSIGHTLPPKYCPNCGRRIEQ